MVNNSKKYDQRFWDKWKQSGAVEGILEAKLRKYNLKIDFPTNEQFVKSIDKYTQPNPNYCFPRIRSPYIQQSTRYVPFNLGVPDSYVPLNSDISLSLKPRDDLVKLINQK